MPIIKKINNHRLTKQRTTEDISTPSISYLEGKIADAIYPYPVLITEDYYLNTEDLGKAFRINPGIGNTLNLYLPFVDNVYDGYRVTFAKVGAGTLIINAVGIDHIAESGTTGYVYNDQNIEIYATIIFEYVDITNTWNIVSKYGSWSVV